MKNLIWALAMLALVGCGTDNFSGFDKGGDGSVIDPATVVVRSRAEIQFSVGETAGSGRFASQSETKVITVTNEQNTSFGIEEGEFVIPTVDGEHEDFGYLAINDLRDNNLKVCGANGLQKCSKALIRLYTSGVAGAGIYNSAEGYGVPLSATLTTPLTIGLDAVQAAVMQVITIPANKRVVNLSDFSPVPRYQIKADFTEAGTGSFSTNLIVEYALAP